MKKIILAFLLITIHFSWCSAQDTIVLSGGDIVLSHVIKVNKRVSFTYFISDTALMADSNWKGIDPTGSINTSEVAYIHYKNGELQKFTSTDTKPSEKRHIDTTKLKLAQDTLLLWSGERITTNIIKVGPRIYLQNYHDLADNRYYLRKAEVHSIYYSDGHVTTWKARDSVPRKFHISVDGGISLPTGDSRSFSAYGRNAALPNNFSNISENDGNGTHFDINFGYKFYRAFNAILLIGEDINPSLNSNLSNGGNQDYHLTQYLAGFGLSTKESTHYFSVRLEWLAGLAMADFPSFSSGTESFNDNFMYASTKTVVSLTNGKGFENYVKGTLEYKPLPCLGIDLAAGFMFANIKYTNSSTYNQTSYTYNYFTQSSSVFSNTTQTNTNQITMPIAALQISLGLSYRF